ncbi:MAG: GTPase Era [Actinomycetaceae bacterium]|nr:GTPase Era [Actinomycetaceae bacterium]MDY6083136.1 GTPase Era [Actinomycetaceae bacterium]
MTPSDVTTNKMGAADYRAGFVAMVGRPNTGKSTLTNAMVGHIIAITSSRPETTRRVIRGVVTTHDGQLILVDTPGLHRPRTLLGLRLNDMVRDALADVDAALLCLPADEKLGPGDRYLMNLLAHQKVRTVAAVTKIDRVSHEALMTHLAALGSLEGIDHIVPVSAFTGANMDELVSVLVSQMPVSPPLYPPHAVSDVSEDVMIAELIREAALMDVRDELPHSIAVTVDDIVEVGADGSLRDVHIGQSAPVADAQNAQAAHLRIHASIHVERDSQKGIVIGHRGAKLAHIRKKARQSINKLLGVHVQLDLHVKVSPSWQRDPKMLERFGF